MLSETNTLAGDASSSTTYARRYVNETKGLYSDASAPLGSPKTLSVSHSQVNRGAAGVADRHLVRLDRTEVNASGVAATASVYVVLEVPRSIVTEAQTLDMVTQLKNFLSSANLDKILNNES